MSAKNEMTKEYMILRSYYIVIHSLVMNYYTYKKLEEEVQNFPKKVPYWMSQAMSSSHDSVVINWCKLFGADNEQTHWKQLFSHQFFSKCFKVIAIKNQCDFRNCFLETADISENGYKKFHAQMLKYRNTVLGHYDIQNEFQKLYPTVTLEFENNRDDILNLLTGKIMLKPGNVEPAIKLTIGLYRILSGVLNLINQGWVSHPIIPETGLEQSSDAYESMIKKMVTCENFDLTEFMIKGKDGCE